MWTLFFLFVLLFFIFLWYTRTHLKERAFALAMAAVEKNGYQLLDDAISLTQVRIFRNGRTFSLMHTFEFHYADEQQHRQVGKVIRHGKGWLNITFSSTVPPNVSQETDRKVIPFPGNYQHD